MTSTAIAASNLYNSANSNVKAAAVESGKKLTGNDSTVEEKSDYEAYQKDKETYLYRMTYNIKEDNADTTKKAVVPKEAEALLESRYPYLDESQIRYILYSTAISSGYSVLDDAEGWGRLNLFEAANGYGAFDTNVTVNMDASKGGFNADDNWKNDISGTGSLTKEGSGMLVLSGNNSYTGDTIVDGDYKQNKGGVLELTISNENDYVDITGNAEFGGKLVLNFKDYVPSSDTEIIKCASVASQFDEIEINAPEGFEGKIAYNDNGVDLVFSQELGNDTIENEINSPQTGDTSNVVMAFIAFIVSLAGILTVSFAGKTKIDRIR
ncbi:MAG: autotransporter-associated beta strand repeat-containing protein [Eubacteriales bacterium]|nr:autotransporter-associated beta strand repeat-containing protein [Eubacteriales bacterium]